MLECNNDMECVMEARDTLLAMANKCFLVRKCRRRSHSHLFHRQCKDLCQRHSKDNNNNNMLEHMYGVPMKDTGNGRQAGRRERASRVSMLAKTHQEKEVMIIIAEVKLQQYEVGGVVSTCWLLAPRLSCCG